MRERKITYRYKTISSELGVGVAMAAAEFIPEEKVMKVSFSFCSPNEKHFSRKKGKTILHGRLDSGLCVILPYDFSEKGSTNKANLVTKIIWGDALLKFDAIVSMRRRNRAVPSWVTVGLADETKISGDQHE